MNEQIRLCNNDDCGWVGWLSDCVHPKHDECKILCPECNETTEYMTPEWVLELIEKTRSG